MKRETTLSADQFDLVLVCLRDRILSISEKIKIAHLHNDCGEGCYGSNPLQYNEKMIELTHDLMQASQLYYGMVTECDYVDGVYARNG